MMGRPALLLGVLAIAGLGCVAETDDRGAEIEVARGRDGGPPSGTCATDDGDRCGGPGIGACWCDELCTSYGDCCPDAGPVCGLDWPEPEPEPAPDPEPEPEPDPDDAAVPAGEHCEPVAEWD